MSNCVWCGAETEPQFQLCEGCGQIRRRRPNSIYVRKREAPARRVTEKRRMDHRGYIRISVIGAPGGWEYEHRLTMERLLGRRLRRGEAVHHKNEDRSDNRPENLELMTLGQHIALHNRLAPKRKRGRLVGGRGNANAA